MSLNKVRRDNHDINISLDAFLVGDFVVKNSHQSVIIFTQNVYDANQFKVEINWFNPSLNVYIMPDWETLPYDRISPHPDLISERLRALIQVAQNDYDVVIIPIVTAIHYLPPFEYLDSHCFNFNKNQKINIEKLKERLVNAGYNIVDKVFTPGEIAIRGSIIDFFPMGSELPFRIDFFDNEIDSIRTFDIDTQKSIYSCNQVEILPARECPLDQEGIENFRNNFREKFSGDPSKSDLYQKISKAIPFNGMEWYLPLFFNKVSTIFDYLPKDTICFIPKSLNESLIQYWNDAYKRFKLFAYDVTRPILEPNQILMSVDEFNNQLNKRNFLKFDRKEIFNLPDLRLCKDKVLNKTKIENLLISMQAKLVFIAESRSRKEILYKNLIELGFKVHSIETLDLVEPEIINLISGPIKTGFVTKNITFVTERELYPDFVHQKKRTYKDKNFNNEVILKDLSEIDIDDPVVHENYGVGRFKGLVNLSNKDNDEFLLITYDNDDKLYVPITQLYSISRYTGGTPESAPLHKLGSNQWDKEKKKALKQAYDTAAELLNIYANRSKQKGLVSTISLHEYNDFVNEFPFEETADQLNTIDAVLKDMESSKPMDRLVCGDVGFGKTEVAMRAAFVSVMNNRQVVVLVPTTLLAKQHFNNFVDRFKSLPIKIAEISRFKTPKEQNESITSLAAGEIDIVIGTHRLLQKDIKFHNIGLVVVDEEHRFGVRQKELLKKFKANADVLTLTATPIPRTLSMSLEGMRDFSIIATPPLKRLSIKTLVATFSEGIIREALLREFNRGGQVYFLHNEVNTIYSMLEKLKALFPESRIAVAHGQMRERELEKVMHDFYQQRFNVLLCTTIIETGIDIPSANTIIINNADRFGLSQLHQLRGRVGRSHHQAFAYLLIDEDRNLTPNAKKRLEAIQMLEDLGSGYFLAMHDLEIRGAGEILGDKQSGNIHEVGFTMYIEMLNKAVKQLKNNEIINLEETQNDNCEININEPTILPNSYCPDPNERLVLYKRLSSCESFEELDEINDELIDRFGLLPLQSQNLIQAHQLRILAKKFKVNKINCMGTTIEVSFMNNANIDPLNLIDLVQNNKNIKLNGPDKINIHGKFENAVIKLECFKSAMELLFKR